MTMEVKSLGSFGGNAAGTIVTTASADFDDVRTLYVRVAGVNDDPVILSPGIETYSSTSLLTGDRMSELAFSVERLFVDEETAVKVPFQVRDVDDKFLNVEVTAVHGFVSISNTKKLLLTDGSSGSFESAFACLQ